MKKLATNSVLCVQPLPQTIVSCRDKDGKNNTLVVGFEVETTGRRNDRVVKTIL